MWMNKYIHKHTIYYMHVPRPFRLLILLCTLSQKYRKTHFLLGFRMKVPISRLLRHVQQLFLANLIPCKVGG